GVGRLLGLFYSLRYRYQGGNFCQRLRSQPSIVYWKTTPLVGDELRYDWRLPRTCKPCVDISISIGFTGAGFWRHRDNTKEQSRAVVDKSKGGYWVLVAHNRYKCGRLFVVSHHVSEHWKG